MPVCVLQLAFANEDNVTVLDDNWYDRRTSKIRVNTFQMNTLPDYRGNEFMGRLVELASAESKLRYEAPLSSGTAFSINDRPISGFAYYPGMRVFEKLELEGKAVYSPVGRKMRWVMK